MPDYVKSCSANDEPLRRIDAEHHIARWVDLMDACEQFLLAGLRRKVGPDGDVVAAHRAWYARQMEEHDAMMLHMLEEFARRSRQDGQ